MRTIIMLCFVWFILKPSHIWVPVDYRDAYCGTYSGKRIYKHLNEQKTAILSDTANYVINVSKNGNDSMIDITTREGKYTAKLTNGKFKNSGIRFFGNFSQDSIYVHHIPTLGPILYRYIAKK